MAVKEEVIQMVSDKFGPFSAKQFEKIAAEKNPEGNPKEFLDASTAYLAKIVGQGIAQKFFSPLYGRYGGG